MTDTFTKKKIEPVDLICGLNFRFKIVITCPRDEDLISADTYLDWANRGNKEDDDYGYSVAIMYSKKAVCRRIDSLILHNHLYNYRGKNYPEKLEALESVGISNGNIVHEFVISPRNELEHAYQFPTKIAAKRAIETTDLYLNYTKSEYQKHCLVVGNLAFTNVGVFFSNDKPPQLKYESCASREAMFIVNIFEEEFQIVYSTSNEIRFSKFTDFTNEQQIKLSNILRSRSHNIGVTGLHSKSMYQELLGKIYQTD
jgi:hypothetical protein